MKFLIFYLSCLDRGLSSLCRLLLYEGGDPLLGKLKPNLDHGKEFIFHPQDGDTPLQLDCSDIKDLIEIEEG